MKVFRKNFFRSFIIFCLLGGAISPLFASEDSLYDFLWLDPDKSVYVLQNKTYKKKHKIMAEIDLFKVVGNEFMDSYGVNVKGSYYIAEEWGVEVFFSHYSNDFNDNYENVKQLNEGSPFLRRINQAYGVMALWTPFYGKVNTFNKIFYFDWGFGLGLASLDAESNIDTVGDPNIESVFKSESYTGLAYKTDFKVHLSKDYHATIEIRNFSFMAPGPRDPSSDELRSHTDFMIGFGVKF
ncbi:MAG: outer membrane beta-barrel domain-containing protein [Halobacteriovoraceae bacterium]|nr:outer membrane beta-barrel domain-containing protein [Halobacteriovoraceae bacterium]